MIQSGSLDILLKWWRGNKVQTQTRAPSNLSNNAVSSSDMFVVSGWLMLTACISLAWFLIPPRPNLHHLCIASTLLALRPRSFGAFFPLVFPLCVDDSSASLQCYLLNRLFGCCFFVFYSEAMDDLGPGGCGGFNSCDCCGAPQDLRATSSNSLAHTYTYTRKHSESRFKSKETNKFAFSYNGVAKKNGFG